MMHGNMKLKNKILCFLFVTSYQFLIQAYAEVSTFGLDSIFHENRWKKNVLVWSGRCPNRRSHANLPFIGRNLQTQPIHFTSKKCKLTRTLRGMNAYTHTRAIKEGGTKTEFLGTGITERNCFVHLPHVLHI
jgi:hypothetical protein